MFGWFRKKPAPEIKTVNVPLVGDDIYEIVGESYRQAEIASVVGRKTEAAVRQDVQIIFVPEDANKHDPYAVAVLIAIEGKTPNPVHVGHIARAEARTYRKKYGKEARGAYGVVVKPEGLDVSFGVFQN